MTILDLNDNTVIFGALEPANRSPAAYTSAAINTGFWLPGQTNFLLHFGVITTSAPTARLILQHSAAGTNPWTAFADSGVMSVSSGFRYVGWFNRGVNDEPWVRGVLTLGGSGGTMPSAMLLIMTNFDTLGRNNTPFDVAPIPEWFTLEAEDEEEDPVSFGEPVGVANKDPDATENYTIDWSDWLNGLSIGTSAWALSSTGITAVASSNSTSTTTIVVSGGTSGESYSLRNRIQTSTSTGATKLISDRTIKLNILEA